MKTHNKKLKISVATTEREDPKGKRQSDRYGNIKRWSKLTTSQRILLLKELHWKYRLSNTEMAKILGKTKGLIHWYFPRYNILHRSKKEAQDNFKKKFGRSPNWKGGKTQNHGYPMLYKPNHLNAKKGGWILEHRFVMSEFLKRPLKKDEIVHHINGDIKDNRIENLELRMRGGRGKYHGVPVYCPKCGFKLL
jgi:hypothetical protein